MRIIGAEEAAEALERGDVAQRRGDDQPRYGDRPTSPASDGPRPVLRFPLGSSSDPRDIERSPVAPADPISEPVELPHWTEPPTGQVPQILPEVPGEDGDDDLDDWTSFATSTPRWRDEGGPSDDHEGFDDMQAWGEERGRAARVPSTAASGPPTTTTSPSPTSTSRGTAVAVGVRGRARGALRRGLGRRRELRRAGAAPGPAAARTTTRPRRPHAAHRRRPRHGHWPSPSASCCSASRCPLQHRARARR